MADVQNNLPQDGVFIEFWSGSDRSAALWITKSGAGIIGLDSRPETLQGTIAAFGRSA